MQARHLRAVVSTVIAVALAVVSTVQFSSAAYAGPAAQSPDAAPSLPGFQLVQTVAYDLYAPNQELLDSSQPGLDAAVEQFQRYFGQAPPNIAVVVFESPEQARTSSIGQLRERGRPVLPWVAPQFLETRAFPNLGIVVRQTVANGGLTVVGLLEVNRPSGLDIQQGDVLKELNGEAIQSIQDLQSRYDSVSVGTQMDLTITRQGTEQTLTFEKPLSRYRLVGNGGSPDPASILSHEAGHVFFISYVNQRMGRPTAGGAQPSYGHPAIPDWFDEAIALLSEPSEMQSSRLAELRRQLQGGATLIPLDELFQMTHPRAPQQAGNSGQAQSGASRGDEIVPGVGLSVGSNADATTDDGTLTDTYAIYYETTALAQFLREREGPAFIGRIGDGLIRGESMSQILADAQHVPTDLDQLRQAVRDWVLSSAAAHSPGGVASTPLDGQRVSYHLRHADSAHRSNEGGLATSGSQSTATVRLSSPQRAR
ncbi:MAG: PDZ domain-containing protein [Chloroflexota bacterium]